MNAREVLENHPEAQRLRALFEENLARLGLTPAAIAEIREGMIRATIDKVVCGNADADDDFWSGRAGQILKGVGFPVLQSEGGE
jgi:hypothetical protein